MTNFKELENRLTLFCDERGLYWSKVNQNKNRYFLEENTQYPEWCTWVTYLEEIDTWKFDDDEKNYWLSPDGIFHQK